VTSIIVVGGGIAGASAAYELAAGADVTLLEREPVCGYHSTGRSAALYTECYGDRVIRRLAMASRAFLERPPDGFTDTPVLLPRSSLFVGTAEQHGALQSALDDYRSMVPSVRGVSAEEAIALCPALHPDRVVGGILEPGASDLDVHALHLGFQRGLRRRGGRLITDAAVTGLHQSDTGWTIESTAGRFAADIVVDAAGAWCDLVGALAGAKPIGLVPKRRTAFTFSGPPGHGRWPMVIDVDEQWYFRPEGPHLLGSPADETPMPPVDVRHDEADGDPVGAPCLGGASLLRGRCSTGQRLGPRSVRLLLAGRPGRFRHQDIAGNGAVRRRDDPAGRAPGGSGRGGNQSGDARGRAPVHR
jgi:D-arginine dehydrogenase